MARWRDTMKSSEKSGESKDLDLERDLPLSAEDITHMGKPRIQDSKDLGSYIDFLEQINAFESRSEKRTFYDSDFEL